MRVIITHEKLTNIEDRNHHPRPCINRVATHRNVHWQGENPQNLLDHMVHNWSSRFRRELRIQWMGLHFRHDWNVVSRKHRNHRLHLLQASRWMDKERNHPPDSDLPHRRSMVAIQVVVRRKATLLGYGRISGHVALRTLHWSVELLAKALE